MWLKYRTTTKQCIPRFPLCKNPRKTSNLMYRGNLGRGGPHRIWGEKGRCLPLHSTPHFSPFLRLLRFILLMIPFLRLILCLHLVSVPPLPHISPSIRLPPCVLTRCVVCLFTRDVNSGMNVRVTVGVTFTASFSRKTPPPPTQVCRALPPVVPPLPPDYVRVIRGLDMLYQD